MVFNWISSLTTSFIIPMRIWILFPGRKFAIVLSWQPWVHSYKFPHPHPSTLHSGLCTPRPDSSWRLPQGMLGLHAWETWALRLEPAEHRASASPSDLERSDIRSPLRRHWNHVKSQQAYSSPTNLHIPNNWHNIQHTFKIWVRIWPCMHARLHIYMHRTFSPWFLP